MSFISVSIDSFVSEPLLESNNEGDFILKNTDRDIFSPKRKNPYFLNHTNNLCSSCQLTVERLVK